jgi:hypothetical protein
VLRVIADVENGGWGEVELGGGMEEDGGIRFGLAELGGDDDCGEERCELETMEERAQAIIPVGNDGEVEGTGTELVQSGQDIGINAPGSGFGEPLVKGLKEGPAGRRIDEAKETVVNESGPIRGRMERLWVDEEGVPETAIQEVGRELAVPVPGGDFGVDVTCGRVWIDEGGADIEGYGTDGWRDSAHGTVR